MANEYIDRINAHHERLITRDEVSELISSDIAEITAMARDKSRDLIDEYGSRNEVKRQIKRLLQKGEILATGISPNAPEASLTVFSDYLSGQTRVMNESFEFILDNEMLARMLDRFGAGIQGNLIVNKLLSQEALNKLSEISDIQ